MSSSRGFEARRYDSTITAVNLSSSETDWRRAFTCSGVSPVYGVIKPVMYMSERAVSRAASTGMLADFTSAGVGVERMYCMIAANLARSSEFTLLGPRVEGDVVPVADGAGIT